MFKFGNKFIMFNGIKCLAEINKYPNNMVTCLQFIYNFINWIIDGMTAANNKSKFQELSQIHLGNRNRYRPKFHRNRYQTGPEPEFRSGPSGHKVGGHKVGGHKVR